MYFQPDIISESNQRRGGTNFRKYYDVFGNPWNSSLTNYPRRERDMFAGIASNQVQAELRRLFNAETGSQTKLFIFLFNFLLLRPLLILLLFTKLQILYKYLDFHLEKLYLNLFYK